MELKTTITMILAVVVAGVVLGASLPLVQAISQESVTVSNDGAGWVRFNYDTSNETLFNYSMNILEDGGAEIYSAGGSSPIMSGTADTILYADNNVAIWTESGTAHILGMSGDTQITMDLMGEISLEKTTEAINVYDSSDNLVASFGVPTWSYIPDSAGIYGYFTNGTEVKKYPADMPLAMVGDFGITAYNNLTSQDLGFTLQVAGEDGYISGGIWGPMASLNLSPAIPPVDESPESNDTVLRYSPPTPQYTSGNWGYDLRGSYAYLVSYSGPSGADVDITIPLTLGGYPVTSLGKSGSHKVIFDTSLTFGSLTIPEGILAINGWAFESANFNGPLVLPSSLTYLGTSAFLNSKFSGDVTIPDSATYLDPSVFQGCTGLTSVSMPSTVNTIPKSMFQGCTGLTSVSIPSNITTISESAFYGCTGLKGTLDIPSTVTSLGKLCFGNVGFSSLINKSNATPNTDTFSGSSIKEVLNLTDVPYSTTSYGLNADDVRADVPASGYISVVSYSKTVTKDGPVYTILELLPVMMALGLVLASVVMIGIKRF